MSQVQLQPTQISLQLQLRRDRHAARAASGPTHQGQLASRRHPRKPRPVLLFRPPIGPAPRARGGCLFSCALSYQGVGLPQCIHRWMDGYDGLQLQVPLQLQPVRQAVSAMWATWLALRTGLLPKTANLPRPTSIASDIPSATTSTTQPAECHFNHLD
jgi:hypothetical protein